LADLRGRGDFNGVAAVLANECLPQLSVSADFGGAWFSLAGPPVRASRLLRSICNDVSSPLVGVDLHQNQQ
jgi:hypothetical protein